MKALFSTLMGGVSGALGGIYGYLAVAVLCLGVGFGGAWHYKTLTEKAAQVDAAKATVRLVVRQGDINMQLAGIVFPAVTLVHSNTDRILQETPSHVTPQIDATYPVPLGFVRVFNDGAHGPIPPASAGGDADPSGVPLSDVADAHTADEGTLDECRVDLNAWWSWYDQQSVAANKASGQ